MDNIEIDPVKEMERLEAMYKHYKILYRKLTLLCCFNQRKVVKRKRDEYKQKIQKMNDLRCQNVKYGSYSRRHTQKLLK